MSPGEKSGPIATLIPAAGASRRLGRPKQLEVVDGEPLLRRAVTRALAANLGPVLVVLGHREEDCRATIADMPCETLVTPHWEQGMGATIRAGATYLATRTELVGILITLVDQWQLTSQDLESLARKWRGSPLPIAAGAYAETLGPPALFGRQRFPDLLELEGDQGARKLLRAHPERVESVVLPNAEADWDVAV